MWELFLTAPSKCLQCVLSIIHTSLQDNLVFQESYSVTAGAWLRSPLCCICMTDHMFGAPKVAKQKPEHSCMDNLRQMMMT